jgi:hypothetical protein
MSQSSGLNPSANLSFDKAMWCEFLDYTTSFKVRVDSEVCRPEPTLTKHPTNLVFFDGGSGGEWLHEINHAYLPAALAFARKRELRNAPDAFKSLAAQMHGRSNPRASKPERGRRLSRLHE